MIHLFHDYEVIKVEQFIDTSWGANVPQTEVYKRCRRCLKAKTIYLDGSWTLEELKGAE